MCLFVANVFDRFLYFSLFICKSHFQHFSFNSFVRCRDKEPNHSMLVAIVGKRAPSAQNVIVLFIVNERHQK